jgi:hypothetical protein
MELWRLRIHKRQPFSYEWAFCLCTKLGALVFGKRKGLETENYLQELSIASDKKTTTPKLFGIEME